MVPDIGALLFFFFFAFPRGRLGIGDMGRTYLHLSHSSSGSHRTPWEIVCMSARPSQRGTGLSGEQSADHTFHPDRHLVKMSQRLACGVFPEVRILSFPFAA